VLVAVTLGWWIRGRYEARRTGPTQHRVRVSEPVSNGCTAGLGFGPE
jgi:hypothetical protein